MYVVHGSIDTHRDPDAIVGLYGAMQEVGFRDPLTGQVGVTRLGVFGAEELVAGEVAKLKAERHMLPDVQLELITPEMAQSYGGLLLSTEVSVHRIEPMDPRVVVEENVPDADALVHAEAILWGEARIRMPAGLATVAHALEAAIFHPLLGGWLESKVVSASRLEIKGWRSPFPAHDPAEERVAIGTSVHVLGQSS